MAHNLAPEGTIISMATVTVGLHVVTLIAVQTKVD